jgi:acyl-[acyl-carrier-protein] desaturase
MDPGTPLIAYGADVIDEGLLLRELDSDVERLLERHLDRSKEWFPHEYVPYERGREHREGDWQDTDADLGGAAIDDAVRSSLIVNLLTEDNLPYYFRTVEGTLGRDGAWGEWVRRWTAEEGRHSMAIYGYLMTTRAVDPVALERDRMAQVSSGKIPEPPSVCDALVYLSLQELATRIAHRSTGAMIGDPVGHEVMSRVASDENLHHLFYRDLAAAAFKVAPDQMMSAVLRQVSGFEMPGFGIRDFAAHARRIASAGIYDLAVHHQQILVPVLLHQWAVDKMSGLNDAGNKAREALMARLDKSARVAERLVERRGNALAAPAL